MASNEDILKRLDTLEKEVISSRMMNTEEHTKILATAKDIQSLTSQLDEVLDNFKGFSNTLRLIKNLLITFGALYLIFKDAIHAALV